MLFLGSYSTTPVNIVGLFCADAFFLFHFIGAQNRKTRELRRRKFRTEHFSIEKFEKKKTNKQTKNKNHENVCQSLLFSIFVSCFFDLT